MVAAEPRLGYDAMVYTSLRAWYAQEHSTPNAAQRLADLAAWRAGGAEPAEWRRRAVVFLLPDRDLGALPWITADSRVERVAAGGETLLLVRRPSQK